MNSSTGVLTVDLAAIQSNWRYIAGQLCAPAQAGAVIKANAYGLGAEHVGPALYAAGCREFFLATLEESLAARDYLPKDAVIYVLGGIRKGAEARCIAADLVPVLFSLEAVRRWGVASALAGRVMPCALKLDTGMTRLGLTVRELDTICEQSALLEHSPPRVFMSHLACADEPDHPLNEQQLYAFEQAAAKIKRLFPEVRLSLANSSGVFLGSKWHFDLVRPGASLYGINPQPGNTNPMAQVVNLKLPVLQVRPLVEPVAVGYGATRCLAPPARVAVVAGGYADGLHRTIGGEGEGIVVGARVSVVGRISMDTTAFDISAVPASIELAEGDYIEVINDQLTPERLAHRSGALGYEILTSLGARYRRDYLPALLVRDK